MLWIVAGATAAIWLALLAVLTAATEPRAVDAGPATLDLPGDESAAVVGLLTSDWELHRHALTATVLDLAARRHIVIEWISPHTFVRVPRSGPPGYGRHPALVASIGAIAAVMGAAVGPAVLAAARALLDGAADLAGADGVPWWARLVVGLVAGTFAAVAAIAALAGAGMLVGGIADLVRKRRTVEGRVLRIRERGDDDDRYWHVAVDDGTTDRVRAWRVGTRPGAQQGDTVRASVTPWLAHVKDLTIVDRRGSAVAAGEAAAPGAPAVPTGPVGPLPALPDPTAAVAGLVHAS